MLRRFRNKLNYYELPQKSTPKCFLFWVDLVVTQIGDHERCREGHWLNVFPSSALECAYIVSNNPSCDNRYFSWANYNDNNCWCAEVGTDCKNNLASQNVVTTWEISTGKPQHDGTNQLLLDINHCNEGETSIYNMVGRNYFSPFRLF